MGINCDIILQWNATPGQLTAVGAALWRWCHRAMIDQGAFRLIDNQPLADLIAGILPAPEQGGGAGVHFRFLDEASPSRADTIASLRQVMPDKGVEDIVINGVSWNLAETKAASRDRSTVHYRSQMRNSR